FPDGHLVLNWESSFYYEFGITRYLNHGWSVSAGYIFNENSVPDSNYQPLVADQNRHFLSAGVGYGYHHLSVDLAYQFGYGPTRTVEGSAVSPLGQSADGKYTFLSNALFLSMGWRF
ncbi:MAG: outer membrane protein transport protein, partial [Desulfobacterales bacterium]|nr:outer membrane protein transport protein [Desulfobacterales bacterium]